MSLTKTNRSQSSSSFKWKIISVGVLAAGCWGLSTVLMKGVLEHIPPIPLLVVQLLVSNAVLWAMVVVQRQAIPPRREILRFGLLGVLQPGLTCTFAIVGLALTSASMETLIFSTETIITIVLAWLLLGERVSLPMMALSVLAFFGVVLVSQSVAGTASGSYLPIGNLLILMGTFCAALYAVLTRRIVVSGNPLLLTALHQAFGLGWVLVVWPFSLLWEEPTPLTDINLGVWALVAISGVMQHALPYWLYLIVLKDLQASLASLFLPLIPVFGVGGAYLFLNEQLVFGQWVGAALILIALIGVSLLNKE